MSTAGFYSPRRQFVREWRVLLRLHGVDVFLGGVYVLGGFYFLHWVGESQVYDVVIPGLVATIHAVYLAYAILLPQSSGSTFPFYFNLPREQMRAWDARLAFLCGVVVWMEAVILVATLLKIGGAGITPHYRLHPETFVSPFLAVAAVASYAHLKHSKGYIVVALLMLVVFFCGFVPWLNSVWMQFGDETNNFFPPRVLALSDQFIFAGLLTVATTALLALIRFRWRRREAGDIR